MTRIFASNYPDCSEDEVAEMRLNAGLAGKPVGECWVWTRNRTRDGYGQMKYRGKRGTLTHRVSWMLVNGSIPPGVCVLHRCDNPPCANPEHLFLGTQDANMKDCAVKGRTGAKLKSSDVNEIRERFASGNTTQEALGYEYGVTQSSISHILNRKTWRHLQ